MSIDGAMFAAAADAPAFAPLDLGPGLWLRAEDLALADGAAVATWTDLSGNARDAAQATAAKRPTYKTNIINGRPALLFDPANSQNMTVAGYIPGNTAAAKMTVFAVAKALNAATLYGIVATRRGTAGWISRLNSASSNEFMYTNVSATPSSLRDNVSLFTTNWNLYEILRDGLTVNLLHNGAPVTTATVFSAYTAQALTPLCISGEDTAATGVPNSAFLSGYIAELMVIDRLVTPGERDAYELYVQNRYAITVT